MGIDAILNELINIFKILSLVFNMSTSIGGIHRDRSALGSSGVCKGHRHPETTGFEDPRPGTLGSLQHRLSGVSHCQAGSIGGHLINTFLIE